MGFLPIAVAIFGFTLLWAVVNYNSLLIRREQVRKMDEERKQLESIRHTMLSKLEVLLSRLSVIDPALLAELQQFPTASSVKTKALSTKVKVYILQHTGNSTHAEIDPLLTSLEDTSFHLYYAHRKWQQSILAYNKLVTRMPSRIVAAISGFRTL